MKRTNMSNIHIDSHAEKAVVYFLAQLFPLIAYTDTSEIHKNIELGCEGGMTYHDRSISMELADVLMSEFGLIYTGLIVNKEFREAFVEAISTEKALDMRNAEFVSKIRRDMGDDMYGVSDHEDYYVIDLSRYNDEIFRQIAGTLARSFNIIEPYEEEVDLFAAELSEDDRIGIGYIASNFMYLIRAFAHNPLFTGYVLKVCEVAGLSLIGSEV